MAAEQTKPDRLAYSVADAAEAMSVSVRTINRWISDGTVAAALVHGRRLIPRAELDRLLTPRADAA